MRILFLFFVVLGCRAQMLMPIINGTAAVVIPTYTGKYCAAHQGGSAVSTLACTWSASPSVGNNVHCYVDNYFGSGAMSISDNASPANTYTANGSLYHGTGTSGYFQWFDSVNLAQAPTTTTVTYSPSGDFSDLLCLEVSGEANSSPADGAVGTHSQASGTSISATVAPTLANDMAVCGGAAGGATWTNGTGFTILNTGGVGTTNVKVEYGVLAASGSQSVSMNYSGGSGTADLICATYK